MVLLDDATHARRQLAQRAAGAAAALQSHWILVACAPRMTHRVSKWVSHGAREHWRGKWAHKLFGELDDWLEQHHPGAERMLARGPLPELLDELRPDEVLDLRRPKGDAPMPESAADAGRGRVLGSLACAWLSLAGMVET